MRLLRIAGRIVDEFECENIRRQCVEQIEILSHIADEMDGSPEMSQSFSDQLNKVKEIQEQYTQNCEVYL